MAKIKEPTCVSIVEKAVTAADDFVTAKWVIENTMLSPSRVAASLKHLKKHNRLSCFESDGYLWWFSTPATDDRLFVQHGRAPETAPRRPKRVKRKLFNEQERDNRVS